MTRLYSEETSRIPKRAPSWGLSSGKRKSSAALMGYWVREYRAKQIAHRPMRYRVVTLEAVMLTG